MVIFFGTIRVPMTAYLYIGHPDWSVHYFTDSKGLPVYALPAMLVAGAACMLLAWNVGSRFMQIEKRFLAGGWLLVTAVALIICVTATFGRLAVYGSYLAYAENLTLGIMDVKLGYVLVAWVVGTAAAASFVCHELHRDARRARSI